MPTPWPDAAAPNWNIKCAQIARLPGLRLVTIESTIQPALFDGALAQKRILWPLLAIKAPKRIMPAHDDGFQIILTRAADVLAAEKLARKGFAEWEHVTLSEEEIESAPIEQDKGNPQRNDEEGHSADDDKDSDWDILSSPSSPCPSPTHPASINDTPRSRTVTDAHRETSDWNNITHDNQLPSRTKDPSIQCR